MKTGLRLLFYRGNGLISRLAVAALLFGSPLTGEAQSAPPSAPSTPVTVAPGVVMRAAIIPAGARAQRVWIYLPSPAKAGPLPVVLIAPAGSRMFHGMALAKGDQPEHLPWAKAGFAVVAYDLSGQINDSMTEAQFKNAARQFTDSKFGIADAHNALTYALSAMPQLDARHVIAVGHSSAATIALQTTTIR